jgi:hypothetical protein
MNDTQKNTRRRRPGRLLLLGLLAIAATFLTVTYTPAQDAGLTLAKLQGPWAATIFGNTGCGLGTMYVTFTLDSTGHANGSATVQTHAQCGNGTAPGRDFNILSLNPNGSGTANLTCGAGCGWSLNIQVAKNTQMFTIVDVSPADPNNYLAGTALHQ